MYNFKLFNKYIYIYIYKLIITFYLILSYAFVLKRNLITRFFGALQEVCNTNEFFTKLCIFSIFQFERDFKII